MLIFGHLGFGAVMAAPFKKIRFGWPLFLGTVLPDLIDKPIYFLSEQTIPSTRSFAHTLVFIVLLTGLSLWRKSPSWWALTFGAVTHILLDNIADAYLFEDSFLINQRIVFWPLFGWEFPDIGQITFDDQLHRLSNFYFMFSEFLGFVFVAAIGFLVWRRRQLKS
ncbi:MAG: metal-dependent hydrolase [Pseudobdellovibrionaceae bacterium]